MRYNLDFKLKVIAYYEQGHTGCATAEEFNLDNKIVIKWVKQHQSDGIDAIRPKTSKAYYSREFKINVLTTLFEQGLSQSEVALKFNISSPALTSHWHKAYLLQGMSGLTSKPKGRATMSKPDDEKTLSELKRELQYLRAENAYLKEMNALLREKEQALRNQRSSKD